MLRSRAARAAYLELRGATVLAQRTWRASHARALQKTAAAQERAQIAAATHIQAVFRARGMHARCDSGVPVVCQWCARHCSGPVVCLWCACGVHASV